MNQDLWMKALNFHGPLLLQTILSEEVQDADSEAEKEKINMCKFIKNKLYLLFNPSDSDINTETEHDPSTVVPIELFQKASYTDRRDLFYKNLDRGSILILQVINDTLPDNYKLLVLYKQENFMKLDDLSIVMYLPKLQAELDLAGGKLESKDLIRAAVCSCSIDERKLYVTLDSNILEDEADSVKLGKISESDLPPYIGNIDFGSSYVEYLHHLPSFNNPDWAEDLNKVLNLNRKYLYSFLDELDGKKYSPEEYGSELKKKLDLELSNAQHAKGLECYGNGNFPDAFIFFNKALAIYPKNAEAMVSRGKLYANKNNLRKAFIDMEEALKIDPNHEEARKHMSVYLVAVARMHMEKNHMDKAKESIDASLNLDSNNQDALAALDELRKIYNKAGSSSTGANLDKTLKMLDKTNPRIGSGSSDGSSSKKDETYGTFLNSSTQAFLSSLKKKHHHDREKDKKGRHHHHGHHKSRSKSPKQKIVDT